MSRSWRNEAGSFELTLNIQVKRWRACGVHYLETVTASFFNDPQLSVQCSWSIRYVTACGCEITEVCFRPSVAFILSSGLEQKRLIKVEMYLFSVQIYSLKTQITVFCSPLWIKIEECYSVREEEGVKERRACVCLSEVWTLHDSAELAQLA